MLTKFALEPIFFGNLVDPHERSVVNMAQNVRIDLRLLIVTPVEFQDTLIIINNNNIN